MAQTQSGRPMSANRQRLRRAATEAPTFTEICAKLIMVGGKDERSGYEATGCTTDDSWLASRQHSDRNWGPPNLLSNGTKTAVI